MRRFGWVALAQVLLMFAAAPAALAEKRIALLIGNEAYTTEIGRLANPHNDVALLEQTLKGLGFEVTTVRDAGLAALHQSVNAYARRVQTAGPNAVGFFYYSGHGAADAGTNYLIPVDVKTAETGELWDQSLRLTEITRKLKSEAGNATHFVVFDACRNTLRLTRPGSKAVVQSKGFLPITQESGMLIAYATAEGELASDVGAGAGPYAKVLAEEIVKPGVEAVYMFRRVQVRVRSAIGQEPWLGFSALGEVYLAGTETASAKPPSQPIVPPRPETGSLGQSLACVNAKFEDDCARAGCTWFLRSCMTRANAIIAKLAIEKTPSAATTCDGVEIAVGQNERRCFKPGAGKTEHFKDCPTCPEMVVVPEGTFMMGSPQDEPQRYDDEGQVQVSIATPFAVGKYAVSFDDWDACSTDGGCNGYKPDDEGWGRGNRPAINVNWNDAMAYVAWLSRKTGKSYRLLSETEREYVTRAGATTPFWWGSSITPAEANYNGSAEPYKGGGSKGQYRNQTVAVESLQPNPWGLYNVHGNVWDWTEDCWNDRTKGVPNDGSARTGYKGDDCTRRVVRGGSWLANPENLRSAYRSTDSARVRRNNIGFRVARTLNP